MSEFNRKLQNKIRGIMKDLKVDDLLLDNLKLNNTLITVYKN